MGIEEEPIERCMCVSAVESKALTGRHEKKKNMRRDPESQLAGWEGFPTKINNGADVDDVFRVDIAYV
jgi:hypothetical protein